MDANEFDVFKLKKEISDVLRKDAKKVSIARGSSRCKSLGCRCIVPISNYNYLPHPSIKYLENDVSNICLKLLNFLMLDGDSNINGNLDLLIEQSIGPSKLSQIYLWRKIRKYQSWINLGR